MVPPPPLPLLPLICRHPAATVCQLSAVAFLGSMLLLSPWLCCDPILAGRGPLLFRLRLQPSVVPWTLRLTLLHAHPMVAALLHSSPPIAPLPTAPAVAIACALDAGDYSSAWALATTNRCDLNLLVDHRWPAFLDRATEFVAQVRVTLVIFKCSDFYCFSSSSNDISGASKGCWGPGSNSTIALLLSCPGLPCPDLPLPCPDLFCPDPSCLACPDLPCSDVLVATSHAAVPPACVCRCQRTRT